MWYTKEQWKARMASRSDLSAYVAHFTRPTTIDGVPHSAIDVLIKILREERIVGSSTQSGFICGDRRAVCFQDAPAYALAQNIYLEQQYQTAMQGGKKRYVGVGLMFEKPYVFRLGGRPVLYEITERAKTLLPQSEWWRIVRYDLGDDARFCDWTHEREWRVPDDFTFSRSKATVIIPSHGGYRLFLKKCRAIGNPDLLQEILGIVNLGAVFY